MNDHITIECRTSRRTGEDLLNVSKAGFNHSMFLTMEQATQLKMRLEQAGA